MQRRASGGDYLRSGLRSGGLGAVDDVGFSPLRWLGKNAEPGVVGLPTAVVAGDVACELCMLSL